MRSEPAISTEEDDVKSWDDLKWWNCGERQVVEEFYDDEILLNPTKDRLYAALDACPFDKVKVTIVGQDPYPDPRLCTGLAFSIPRSIPPKEFPPTLENILKEYSEDLGVPYPDHGDLSSWCKKGVLLWNAIPTCIAYKSMSHSEVCEWTYLTREIVEALANRGNVVFVFLGVVAKQYEPYSYHIFDGVPNERILVSHPSPRASLSAKHPFRGSRLFSIINAKLVTLGQEPIDWRL